MSIVCPFCGSDLWAINSTKLQCSKHKIMFDTSKYRVYMDAAAPAYVQDSMKLLREVSEGRVWAAYGNYDVFEEGFRYHETTIIHNVDQPEMFEKHPKKGQKLIAYGQLVSRYVYNVLPAQLILNDDVATLPHGIDINFTDVDTNLMLWLSSAQVNKNINSEQHHALTAFIAPTAAQTADALLHRTADLCMGLTPSQFTFALMYGNKSQLCRFLNTKCLISDIRSFLIDTAKHCTMVNVWRKRDEVQYSNYVKSMSPTERAELLSYDYCPELELLPGNEWLFYYRDIHSSCSSTLKHCNSSEDAEFMKTLYWLLRAMQEVWGIPYTLNKEDLEMARSKVPGGSPTEIYLAYWNIVSEKLEKGTGL